MLQKKNILYLFITVVLIQGCNKLEEPFRGDLTEGQVSADSANTASLLLGLYNSLQFPFCSHLVVFPLQELSTDEAIAPTRGQDWDDNGVWRVLHQHKWDANSDKIKECFNALNGISYAATDLLRYHPKKKEQAEARFIRAWVMYLLLDLFDQVPYRDPGENLNKPASVRKGTEALDYIISEIYAVETDLDDGPVFKANKYAARVLLMKCFLNKAVYINRANPTPEKTDMDKVISLADTIIKTGGFSFSGNYFDNFAPDNTSLGKENIFTILNERFKLPFGTIMLSYGAPLHYKSYGVFWGLAGFNGWATLSDFYDRFEPTDKRRGDAYSSAGSPANQGKHINVGFLIGQQFSLYNNDSLHELNTPNYLNFTREVHNIELGANLESTGIRPVKYFPDFFDGPNSYFSPDNDFVFFRLSDVLLMKAEGILRGGTPTPAGSYGSTAKEIVNSIRTDPSRNASALSNVTLEILLDERGREMWWEGWRRQDLIRFGQFLRPYQERNYQSDPKHLLYPIPAEQIAVNPNLLQNPGY